MLFHPYPCLLATFLSNSKSSTMPFQLSSVVGAMAVHPFYLISIVYKWRWGSGMTKCGGRVV